MIHFQGPHEYFAQMPISYQNFIELCLEICLELLKGESDTSASF